MKAIRSPLCLHTLQFPILLDFCLKQLQDISFALLLPICIIISFLHCQIELHYYSVLHSNRHIFLSLTSTVKYFQSSLAVLFIQFLHLFWHVLFKFLSVSLLIYLSLNYHLRITHIKFKTPRFILSQTPYLNFILLRVQRIKE